MRLSPLHLMFISFIVLMFFIQIILCRRGIRTLRSWQLPPLTSWLAASALCLFFAAMLAPTALRFAGIRIFGFLPSSIRYPYRMIFLVWMFSSFFTFLVLFASDSLSWAARRLRTWRSFAPVAPTLAITPAAAPRSSLEAAANPSRRQFLQFVTVGAATLPFGMSAYGAVWGRSRLQIVRRDIFLDNLPPPLRGLTIGQMSDIHCGDFMSWRAIHDLAQTLQELQPELIALTGDFVSRTRGELITCIDALEGLHAPLGVFACLGNHEYWARVEGEAAAEFARIGARLLVDESVQVERNGSHLTVLGLDDAWSGHADWGRTVAGVDQTAPKLLLSHIPDVIPTAARHGIDLTLSGHYHGGQVKLPGGRFGLSPAMLLTHYVEGLYRYDRAQLYVNRGVGTTGLPVRLNARPEITLLTLRHTSEA